LPTSSKAEATTGWFIKMDLNLAQNFIHQIHSFFKDSVDVILFNDGKFIDEASSFDRSINCCKFKASDTDFEYQSLSTTQKPLVFLFNWNSELKEIQKPKISIEIKAHVKKDFLEIQLSDFQWGSRIPDSENRNSTDKNIPIEVDFSFNLSESSELNYYRLSFLSSHLDDIGLSQFFINEKVGLHSFIFSKNASKSQHRLLAQFKAENSIAHFYAATLTEKNNVSEHFSNIEHHVGNCSSEQLYKYVLLDSSKASFTGKIYIAPKAQKANSNQLVQSLLVGEKVESRTQPILQIYADDVKATHGSTHGQINSEELFYLQSRGLDKDKSLLILNKAFLEEIFLKIQNLEIRNFCLYIFNFNPFEMEKKL